MAPDPPPLRSTDPRALRTDPVRSSVPKFPAFWVKLAWAITGATLLAVLVAWLVVVWAVATGS